MNGQWTAQNAHIWSLQSHHFRGRCEINIKRPLYSFEKSEDYPSGYVEVARLELGRNDIEVLHEMMMKCSKPEKEYQV